MVRGWVDGGWWWYWWAGGWVVVVVVVMVAVVAVMVAMVVVVPMVPMVDTTTHECSDNTVGTATSHCGATHGCRYTESFIEVPSQPIIPFKPQTIPNMN